MLYGSKENSQAAFRNG